jgi:multidrug resistance efflux pump
MWIVVTGLVVAGAVWYARLRPSELVLTGIVTADDVIVSPLVGGSLDKLLVKEGDRVVRGQLLAVLAPAELETDRDYAEANARGYGSQIAESQATLRFQEQQTSQQIRQAEASLAAVEAQQVEAAANLENATANQRRIGALVARASATQQEADAAATTLSVATARLAAVRRQVDAQRATVALARANAEQVIARRSALDTVKEQRDAAQAQANKAVVRLGYTELHAPVSGIVDVRAARAGEVVSTGQPVVTLIDPDDLWVRVDVEETYVPGVRLGDHLRVRLPSGDELDGVVFHRGVDAAFATQRDVSRTKRDIKTFELRLRVDDKSRKLAVGMTAYVLLPVRR